MARTLQDMVVVITGASAGIGRSLAEQLSARGAKLVLSARRLQRLEELNETLGGRHLAVQADVSDPIQCEQLIERSIERFGRIDTLICNAGYGIVRPIAQTTAEEMRAIFATNVFGTTDCIRAAIPHMLRQEPRDGVRGVRGQIMIVSSAAGRRGVPYFGAYSATKYAQIGIAEALRVELREHAIAVTSVHPVGTESEFHATAETISAAAIPKRSWVEPRQTAAGVARRMIRAIERPVPELWPYRPMRWLITLGILMPSVADRIMARSRAVAAGAESR